MTIQTKQFIELSGIISMRCECKNSECRTVLILPLEVEMNGALRICPKCRNEWAQFQHHTYELDIRKFTAELKKLKESAASLGFNLTLEISESAVHQP